MHSSEPRKHNLLELDVSYRAVAMVSSGAFLILNFQRRTRAIVKSDSEHFYAFSFCLFKKKTMKDKSVLCVLSFIKAQSKSFPSCVY